MALDVKKNITLSGVSKVGSDMVVTYSGTIDSDNPENLQLSTYIQNMTAYRANLAELRNDKSDFEDVAFDLQDTLMGEVDEA